VLATDLYHLLIRPPDIPALPVRLGEFALRRWRNQVDLAGCSLRDSVTLKEKQPLLESRIR
jgi:hypothetical protein